MKPTRQEIEEIVNDLKTRTVSREELRERIGCSDRAARRILSEVAKRHPVISLSDGKGYRIAKDADDVVDALHASNENAKRAQEILKRNEPLNTFLLNQGAIR